MDLLFGFAFAAVLLIAALWFCIILPYEMAEDRGRSGIGWVLVSLIFSPIAAIVILWLIGDVEGDL